jgi:hypothetical protein
VHTLILLSQSNASAAVEDSLSNLAKKYITTRFVKLDHEIAEMEHIDVPAILAYKAGEVFATLSDCRPDGLETSLRQSVLSPYALSMFGLPFVNNAFQERRSLLTPKLKPGSCRLLPYQHLIPNLQLRYRFHVSGGSASLLLSTL